jgi:hypothetical protein
MALSEYPFDLSSLWDEADPILGCAAVASQTQLPERSSPKSWGSSVRVVGVGSTLEERAMWLRTAAVIGSLKSTKKAVRRCRKRVRRVVRQMEAGAVDLGAPYDATLLIGAAVADMRRNCSVCKRCEGA